jgi:hypothetical protein
MTHFIEIPHSNSIRYYPVDPVLDARYNFKHLDEDWFKNQQLWFHKKVHYTQKWQQNDHIPQQFKSTLTPVEIDILDCNGRIVVPDIPVPNKVVSVTGEDWYCYEGTIDLNTIVPGSTPLPEGEYYFLLTAGTGLNKIFALSEPQYIKARWPKTLLFEYSNSRNDYDVLWETGIQMQLRAESILEDYQFKRNRSSSENQMQNIITTRSIPYRSMKLKIGGEGGAAPWLADKFNHMLSLSSITADGLLIVPDEGAEIEAEFIPGYPAPFYSIDVREGRNLYSKRITREGELNAGFLTSFNLNSFTWFGSIGGDANSQPVRIQKEI